MSGALDHFTTAPLNHLRLNIYDPAGRLILSSPVLNSSFILRTSSFPASVYLARLAPAPLTATQKLIIQP